MRRDGSGHTSYVKAADGRGMRPQIVARRSEFPGVRMGGGDRFERYRIVLVFGYTHFTSHSCPYLFGGLFCWGRDEVFDGTS